jgi:hypothetical protein
MTTDSTIVEISTQFGNLSLGEDTIRESNNEVKVEHKGKSKERPPKPKVPKPHPATLYWGVELDPIVILEHPTIKASLTSHAELIPLVKMHSTLLYVGGKRDNPNEESIKMYEGKMCTLTIDAMGSSLNAVALRVADIKFDEIPDKVPTFAICQHVTVALSKGTKAVNSVKTLQGDGDVTIFAKIMELKGVIKRYIN